MSPEFHQRVRDLFDLALEKPDIERRGFVLSACGDDVHLLRAVMELLDAHGEADSFLAEPAAPRTQRIGRYQVVKELGRGGMGVVYEAVDTLIGRTVAVKQIQLESLAGGADAEHTWKQLLTEAQSAGLLSHPGIVIVYDVGQEEDTAFIAMERVEGPSLEQVLDRNTKLAWPAALDMLRQTAAALDYAHESGVLHRDIKPANIMIHRGTIVKIADFGLAKITSNPRLTRTRVAMGTPAYMSPERIALEPLDGRCDQFSLAVIAFQMLTGSKPFAGGSIPQVLFQITSRERPSACELEPNLPASVDHVLHRGLAMRPEDRYPTCAAFVAALQEVLGNRRTAPSTPPPAITRPAPSTPPVTPPPVVTRVTTPPPVVTRVDTPTPSFTRVTTPPPVAPQPPAPAAVPGKASPWPLVMVAAAGTVAAVGLGVLAVRKFVPPPSLETPVKIPARPVEPKPTAPPPTIVRFAVEPETIEPGESAKLAWVVSGATEIEIVPSVGVVAASGTSAVAPSSPTNYLLTASGPGGRVKASVLVDVKAKSSAMVIKPPADKRAGKAEEKPVPPETTPPARATAPVQATAPAQTAPPTQTAPPPPPPVDNATRARQLYQQAIEARRSGQAPRALELFREAAELNDLRAMLEVGKMYRSGEGIAADIHESARWFRKAADAGHTPAMVLVGLLYFEGKPYTKDLPEAVRWFRKAAEANDALGMDELGQMYANGFGVPKDEHQAFLWFEKSAGAGNHFGLFHLGRCYERGTGVAKDMKQATAYYEKAAAAGNADAKRRLTQLAGGSATGAVSMAANQQWTDTGIAVKAGDTVAITASGSMKMPVALRIPAMTPAGSTVTCKEAAAIYGSPAGSPAPPLLCWSLIGRIGPAGPIFAVGAGKTFQAATPGELYLGINHENVQQNVGTWRAVIKVQR